MTSADIPEARRLQREEGWNQQEADWRLFLDGHPGGCFVAVAAEDGGVITHTHT